MFMSEMLRESILIRRVKSLFFFLASVNNPKHIARTILLIQKIVIRKDLIFEEEKG